MTSQYCVKHDQHPPQCEHSNELVMTDEKAICLFFLNVLGLKNQESNLPQIHWLRHLYLLH